MNIYFTLLLLLSPQVTVELSRELRKSGWSEFTLRLHEPWKVSSEAAFGVLESPSRYVSKLGSVPLESVEGSDADISVQTNPKDFVDTQKVRREFKPRIQRLNTQNSNNASRMVERKLPWEEELIIILYFQSQDVQASTPIASVSAYRTGSRGQIIGNAMLRGSNVEDQIEAFIRTVRSVNYKR